MGRKRLRLIEDSACSYGHRRRKLSGLHKNRIKVGRNELHVTNDSLIGIASRDISSFVNNVLKSSDVAEFLSVPKDIFELNNLAEVLSYHTWETDLSCLEKLYLQQFLPSGMDADLVVKSLLTEENLHFGNPFTKWSASLFSRELCSESILHNSQHLKSRKKDYLSRLFKYHYEMIDSLLEWKAFWESCENPEILESMWSKGIRHLGYATSKKVMPDRRTSKKGNGNKIQINDGNGDTYNSFLKINDRSFQLDKNANHSVSHIKSKSLNSNLGDMKKISTTHEEEERKIINEHWLKLACKEIPNTYKHFINEKLSRVQCKKFLKQELVEKYKMIVCKKSQQDDCSIPYSECDKLEIPSAVDHFANEDSDESMEHQFSEQIDDGESQHQSEVNLPVAGNGSSIPHTNRDDFEKLPDSSYLDLTPMVPEEGHQSLINPPLKQSSQLFLNCVAKTTEIPLMQNILSLNNVQESRYFLPDQEIVNSEPLQFHGNIEQTMIALEPKDNIPFSNNDGMGIEYQDSCIHSQSYLNAPVGGISLDLLQETEMKSLFPDVVNDKPSNYIMSNLPLFGNQISSQGGSFIQTPVSGRHSLHHSPHQLLNNPRSPLSSSTILNNALQQRPHQLPIDFQRHRGQLNNLRLPLSSSTVSSNALQQQPHQLPIDFQRHRGQLNNPRLPLSSSTVSSNALQQRPHQLPIDFQRHRGQLNNPRLPLSSSTVSSNALQQRPHQLPIDFQRHRGQLNNPRLPLSFSTVSSNALQQQPHQLPIDFQRHRGQVHDLRISRETLASKSLAENKGFIFNSYLDQDHQSADVSRSQVHGFNKLCDVNPSLLASQSRGNINSLFGSSIPQSKQIPPMHLYNSSHDIQQFIPQDRYINMDGTLPGDDVTHVLYSNRPGIFGNHETSFNPSIAKMINMPNMQLTKVGHQNLSKQNSSEGEPFIRGGKQ